MVRSRMKNSLLDKYFWQKDKGTKIALSLSALGLVIFLLITFVTPFRNALFKTLFPKPVSKAAGVDLTINPQQVTVAPGGTFTINVDMNTNNFSVSAAEVHINFDSTKLTFKSATIGTMLPVVLVGASSIGSEVSFTVGAQPTTPATGSGTLATITFQAAAASTSTISFANTTQVAAIGQTGNMVGVLTPSQVTVAVPATPTPVPTAAPTPAATPVTTPAPPLPNADLTIVPVIANVSAGQTFNLAVDVNSNGDSISAAQLELTYDTTKLAIQSVVQGPMLPVLLSSGQANNGIISITVGSQPTSPVTGVGTLAVITAKALVAGTTLIDFTANTKITATGKNINDIKTKAGSQVVIGATVTPTPNPSPALAVGSCESYTNCSANQKCSHHICEPIGSKGDGNNDGKVDLADLSVLLTHYSKSKDNDGDYPFEIDENNDGLINVFDFSQLIVLLRSGGIIH